MRIKIWGARGSIANSGPETRKYGGNTSCIEIRTRSNDHIILDAGTGIRQLGVEIMSQSSGPAPDLERTVEFMVEHLMEKISVERPKTLMALEGSLRYKDEFHLFLSHFHWDHIQGFPFFVPAYVPGKKLNIYGQLKADHRLYDVFDGQMSKTYFPVYLDQMMSEKVFREILEDTIRIGDATITSRCLNHPQGCLGYRIVSGEMVVAYATDTEHTDDGLDENLLELADGADILFYDSQYSPDEYELKKSWGHSTWEAGVKIAREAGVKKLVLWHHDPEHDDTYIDNMEKEAREQFPNLIAAQENMVITDFPVEPTEDIRISYANAEEASRMPGIEMRNNRLTIECGASFMPMRSREFVKKIAAELSSGARQLVFDCAKVKHSNGEELIALADTINDLCGNTIEAEIINPPNLLEKRLIEARFPLVATMKHPPPWKK